MLRFLRFTVFSPSNCLYIQASGASKAQKSQGLPIKNPYHIQGQKNECIFSPFGGYIFFYLSVKQKKKKKTPEFCYVLVFKSKNICSTELCKTFLKAS